MQSKMNKSKDADCNVYIANLPHDLGKNRLHALFSPYGTIIRHKFVAPQVNILFIPNSHKHHNTHSPNDIQNISEPGYGFVQFQDKHCAQTAIKALTNFTFPTGEKIYISLALHRRSSLSDEPTNLYVKNVPHSWTSDILRKEFSVFGGIRQCKIVKEGIAFVRFNDHNQALNAIDGLNGKYMDRMLQQNTKPLHIEFATRKSAATSYQTQSISESAKNNEHNLYVRNLPYSFTQKQLETLFKVYGKISAAKLGSKGIAFVRFVKAEDAQNCIQQLHRTKPDGFEQEIVVKLAHFDIGDCRNRANGNFKSTEVMQKAQPMMQVGEGNMTTKSMNNSPVVAPNLLQSNVALLNSVNLLNLNVMQSPNMLQVGVQNGIPPLLAMPALPAIPLVGQLPQYPMHGQLGYIIPPPPLMSVPLNTPLFATTSTPPPQLK